MKVEEARAICPRFNPVRNPETKKVACEHRVLAADGTKLCTLPSYFICLLEDGQAKPAADSAPSTPSPAMEVVGEVVKVASAVASAAVAPSNPIAAVVIQAAEPVIEELVEAVVEHIDERIKTARPEVEAQTHKQVLGILERMIDPEESRAGVCCHAPGCPNEVADKGPSLPQAAPAAQAAPTAPPEPAPAAQGLNLDPHPRADHGELWSYSRLGCWQSCPKKYWLRYLCRAEGALKKSLVLGKEFHRGRELIDSNPPAWDGTLNLDPKDVAEAGISAEDQIKLVEVLKEYQKLKPFNMAANEAHFILEDFLLQGYYDGVDVESWIHEFKYIMSDSDYNQLTQGRQAAIYLLSFRESLGVSLDLVRKPGERLGRKESLEEFREKVLKSIEKHGLMSIIELARKDFDLDRELAEVKAIIEQCKQGVELFARLGTFPGNRSVFTCPDCEFYQWCLLTVACPIRCQGECKLPKGAGEKLTSICQAVSAYWR